MEESVSLLAILKSTSLLLAPTIHIVITDWPQPVSAKLSKLSFHCCVWYDKYQLQDITADFSPLYLQLVVSTYFVMKNAAFQSNRIKYSNLVQMLLFNQQLSLWHNHICFFNLWNPHVSNWTYILSNSRALPILFLYYAFLTSYHKLGQISCVMHHISCITMIYGICCMI